MWLLPLEIVVLVVFLVIGTVLTEVESFGWATVVLLATVVGVQLFHVVDILQWVSAHLALTGLYVLAYLGIGVVWSFVKWFSFLMGFRDAYRTKKEEWARDNNVSLLMGLNETQSKAFMTWLKSRSSYHTNYKGLSLDEKPKASDNKSRIVAWMAFFPCSMIGTLLNDPVRRLFNWLFNSFKALYQQMADAVFRNDKELQ